MLTAIDTNVLLRLLLQDDTAQVRKAEALVETDSIYIPVTVILETEWVLRSHYKWSKNQIAGVLRLLADVPNMILQESQGILWALDRLEDGADFADMLHLVCATYADRFVTFDRDFVRVAADQSSIPFELLT